MDVPGEHVSAEQSAASKADFEKYRPIITHLIETQAAQALSEGAETLSLNGRKLALDSFMLLLTDESSTRGFIMGDYCARQLCAILIEEGFSPQNTRTAE